MLTSHYCAEAAFSAPTSAEKVAERWSQAAANSDAAAAVAVAAI